MMQRADVTALGAPRDGAAETRSLDRTRRALRRAWPLLPPWAPLQPMAGVAQTCGGITLVRGRLDGGRFTAVETTHEPGPDIAGGLRRLGDRWDGPVCASLPRSRTLVRHFRVPDAAADEIAAMLPHLLAGELPLPVDQFSWAWTRLPARADGFCPVTVLLSRNDQLEAYVAPLLAAGLDVVGVVPEGCGWARTLVPTGGAEDAGDEPVCHSFVIQLDGAPYLIVEHGGELLFDMILDPRDRRVPGGPPAGSQGGPDLAEAERRFSELFGLSLPPPQPGPPTGPGGAGVHETWARFAAAVAEAAADPRCILLPPAVRRAGRIRLARRTAGRLARLALVTAACWAALAAWDGQRTRTRLETLQAELSAGAAEALVLETEWAAVGAAERDRAGRAPVLAAVESLRRHVAPPVNLEHLEFVQGHGVTLRGGAPANEHVLAMMEKLAADPVWSSLRVVQLRSAANDGDNRVGFVIEGRLE
jgi:hypothetical protein